MYKKMTIGIKFSGIKVNGNLIIDGHHRYLASLLSGIQLDRYPTLQTSATELTDWSNVEFVKEDWDTEAKIAILNETDAKYNGIALEDLLKMLQ